ncbi:hypothetical protein HDU98_007143 [Podochytrium sp. JEL0797]|nr:hypothetical protein HDU98_007143 [Podochytrium sp. JEL0797]
MEFIKEQAAGYAAEKAEDEMIEEVLENLLGKETGDRVAKVVDQQMDNGNLDVGAIVSEIVAPPPPKKEGFFEALFHHKEEPPAPPADPIQALLGKVLGKDDHAAKAAEKKEHTVMERIEEFMGAK